MTISYKKIRHESFSVTDAQHIRLKLMGAALPIIKIPTQNKPCRRFFNLKFLCVWWLFLHHDAAKVNVETFPSFAYIICPAVLSKFM